METHFEILIDASGSMGYMKDSKELENKYLLPDGSTRTDLVKKILNNNIYPKLNFLNHIEVNTFRGYHIKDKNDNYITGKDNKNVLYTERKVVYQEIFNQEKLINSTNLIVNPPLGGTPLYSALIYPIHKNKNKKISLILISDGDANDILNFDERIIEEINKLHYNITIFIIGIDQNEIAQKKCKNLTSFTKGNYINLQTINYNYDCFDSLLFELKASIASSELNKTTEKKETIKTEQSTSESIEEKVIIEDNKETILSLKVTENSKSLVLISNQLDNIVNELKYLRKSRTTDENEDEVEINEDEAYNIKIGWQCEQHLNEQFLKIKYDEVIWLNEIEEQGKPYDFQINNKGETFFIECKGTSGNSNEFFLTKNEWEFYLKIKKQYRLYFVSEINSIVPKIRSFEDILASMETLELTPFSSKNRKLKADRIILQINN